MPRRDDIILNQFGTPVSGASVRVCTDVATGTPCSPLASIYSDDGLSISLPNPTTSDANGNYFFYAAVGEYKVQISGTGITTLTFPDQVVPPSTAAGSGTVTNTLGSLTANALIIGNGGADEKVVGSLGTTTTVLHGNAAGAPTFGSVALATDVSGQLPVGAVGSAGLSGTSPISVAATGVVSCPTCTTAASSLTSNQLVIGSGSQGEASLGSLGTTTTVLHGNASGAPSFGAIVQGDVTNGYVDLSSTQTVNGNKTIGGNNLYTGTATFTGDTRLSNVGTFNVEIWVGTSEFPTLASAISAATASTTIRLPSGVYQISGTQNITVPNLKIIGDGADVSFIQITSATADYFSVQASGFELSNVTLYSSVTRTAGFVIVNGSAASANPLTGYIHDVSLLDVYGGFQLAPNSNGSNGPAGWNIHHINVKTSVGLHTGSLFVIGGVGSGGTSDIVIKDIYITQAASTADAAQVIVDTGADTIKFYNFDAGFSAGVSQSQPVFLFQNSQAGVPPKFIRIVESSWEGGGSTSTTDCTIINWGADIDIADSYIANCGVRGITIAGGTNVNGPIRFHHNWVGNNQKGGLYVTSAVSNSAAIQIDGNTFNANSINTTNTFDDLQVAGGTVGFSITNNHFGNNVFNSTQKSRYGINLLSGTNNNYIVSGNNCDPTQMGTACFIDSTTTANPIRFVEAPLATNWVVSAAAGGETQVTLSDPSSRSAILRSAGSVNNTAFGSTFNGSVDFLQNSAVGMTLDTTKSLLVAGTNIRPISVNNTDLGSAAVPFVNLWLGTAGTNNIKLTGTGSAARIATLPDNTGTLAELNLAQTWTAAQSFGAGGVLPTSAGTAILGTAALPIGTVQIGTAATNNFALTPLSTSGARTINIPDFGVAASTTQNFPFVVQLTSQYTNSTTSFTNVTGGNSLSFVAAASKNYTMTCHLYYQAASTGGLNIEFTGPASPTTVIYGLTDPSAATTFNTSVATAYSTSLGTAVSTAATNFDAIVSFSLINGTNAGTVQMLAKSSAAVQLQIQAGSYCVVQ